MIRSDLSNYTPFYGGGPGLVTELVKLVGYVQVHPQNAQAILTLLTADINKVSGIIGDLIPEPEPEPEG